MRDTLLVIGSQVGYSALWEVDPAHPGGEVFVDGNRPVRVAPTPLVRIKLQRGELRIVEEAEAVDVEPAPVVDATEDDEPESTDDPQPAESQPAEQPRRRGRPAKAAK